MHITIYCLLMDYTDITIDTYNRIYEDYASHNKTAGKNIKILRRIFTKLLSHTQDPHILDLGCANGRDVEYFLKQGYKVTGIDLCQPFLDLAKKNNPSATFINMDMRELKFPENHFDGIWALASLLHIAKKDLPDTVKDLYRILKPNGIILAAVMEGEHDSLRKNVNLNWPDRHFSDFNQKELKELFVRQGFKYIKKDLMPSNWGPLWLCYFFSK